MRFVDQFINEVQTLANAGGWVFIALLLLAFGIAFSLLSLWSAMHSPNAPLLSSRDWVVLLKGKYGNDSALKHLCSRLNGTGDPARHLQEIALCLFAGSERRFSFAFIMIGAAPLVGLLGTVSGMFATFSGMSKASATAPIDSISDGISQALITTQTGLVIGVPAYIVCAWLKSRHDHLVLEFARLESQLLQEIEP